MGGLLLDLTAAVWRMTAAPGGGFVEGVIYPAVRCAIVPVSSFDSNQPFAYQSTHIVWVQNWVQLRKEDQVRYGRRLPDLAGNVVPYVYVVNGLRRFTDGGTQRAYYVREQD
jgi:hypothetical protein